MSANAVLWSAFGAAIVVMLALDLGVFHRRAREVGTREAVVWSAVWIALALLFGALVLLERGVQPAAHYLTAYVIEKSLSVDNIFVFLLIFSYFGVPAAYQHRVLFWGIVTAVAMRAVLIGGGVAAVQRFHWLMYLLGAVLIVTGVRMARGKDRHVDPSRNPVIRLCARMLRTGDRYEGAKFFTRDARGVVATPLFIVLLAVETTDLVFALDSIPAVLAITTDPMIAYTSNIFAILGLRALYFAVAGILPRFRYLHHGLSIILVLIGVKMLVAEWYRPPTGVTLTMVMAILAAAVALSVWRPEQVAAPGPTSSRGPRGAAER